MKRKIILSILVALVLISFIPAVSAFGVSASYWDTRPLKLGQGETEVVPLGLQNTLGTKDLTLKAELASGSEIAQIIDGKNEYFLPIKSDGEVFVNVKVEIPNDAQIGKKYNVAVTLTTISPGKTGGVGIGMSIVKKFPVIIVTPTGSTTDPVVYYILGAVVVIMLGLGIILLSKRKLISKGRRKRK